MAEVIRISLAGNLSSYSWSECSRTCGGGVRKSVRECDNPTPANGGLYCTGDRIRYESCHTNDCQHHSDLRLEQCRAYNGNNLNIQDLPDNVQWVPKYTDSKIISYSVVTIYPVFKVGSSDKCKLYCRVEYSSAYYLLASSVVDGTPCGVDTYDMCVGGECVSAGCDHVLGSSARLG